MEKQSQKVTKKIENKITEGQNQKVTKKIGKTITEKQSLKLIKKKLENRSYGGTKLKNIKEETREDIDITRLAKNRIGYLHSDAMTD